MEDLDEFLTLQGGYKGPLCGYQLLEVSDADRQSLDKALAAAKITAKAGCFANADSVRGYPAGNPRRERADDR